jgi:hypothetical protein
MIHWVRREHRHGLIESDASDVHKKVYGVTGLAGIRTVPVMLLDDDLAAQPGDEVMVAARRGQHVPREGTARPRVAGDPQALRQTHDPRPQEGARTVSSEGERE